MNTMPFCRRSSAVPLAQPRPCVWFPARVFRWLGLGSLLLLAAVGALAGPVPSVRIEPAIPTEVMIGSTYTFSLYFKNTGSTEGYGPFIDLYLDAGGVDQDTAGPCGSPGCDGLKLVSVSGPFQDPTFGGGSGFIDLGATAPCSSLPNSVVHPFAGSGVTSPLCVPAGGNLSVIRLKNNVVYPHTVYPYEPEFRVDVTVQISPFADPYDASSFTGQLLVMARAGFQYGADPLENPSLDPPVLEVPWDPCGWLGFGWYAANNLRPTVFKVSKTYFGPENETATGPNNLHYYGVVVDVAPGQTIQNLKIQDLFPDNMVFADSIPVKVWQNPVPAPANDYYSGTLLTGGLCGSGVDYEITVPTPAGVPTLWPDNVLEISMCQDVVGVAGPELAVVFAFYVPERDAHGDLILDPDFCTVAYSTNDVRLEGNWVPADCRDWGSGSSHAIQVVSDVDKADHVLQAKCLAIQKSWEPVITGKPVVPGDQIRYTLNFQVSDYRTLDDVEVVDYLSDGQKLVANSISLTVNDQFGTTTASGAAILPVGLVEEANQTPVCQNPPTVFAPSTATKLTFRVSALMASLNPPATRHGNGILTGGSAAPPPLPAVAAHGQIVFVVEVQDQFDHPQGSRPGDLFVDKSDVLDNCVSIHGAVLNNEPPSAIPATHNGCIAQDMSQVRVPIEGTQLTKSIYAIKRNGVNLPAPLLLAPALLAPGDEVTFRLQMPLPSGDGENLVIRDWLNLPIFSLDDPTASGAGPIWASPSALPPWGFYGPPAPPPGKATAGPLHWSALIPPATVMAYSPLQTPPAPGQNALEFLFGSFNDPLNQPQTVDVLFTLTVTKAAFADGYVFANVAQECEDNTFSSGTNICTSATFDLRLGQPNLKLSKGVVAVDEMMSPNAVFTPALGSPAFTSPSVGGCPRFSGIVRAANLTSDVSGLNPGTVVTFAIVVENLGSGPLGAFDVTVSDVLPPCFIAVGGVCVSYGDPALPAPGYSGDLFSTPLQLNDPGTGVGALGPLGGAPGANVAVITFDALYDSSPGATCCTNRAELTRYSNIEGGANFITAELFAQAVDEARACEADCVPQIICATNKTILCGAPVVWDSPVVTNSCCGTNVTITVLSTVTSNGCPRTMTRTWRILDTCGHSNLCQQTITLLDSTPPVISRCATNLTLTPGTNCLATIPDMRGQLIATDNCGPRTITQSPLLIQVGPGTYPVVFTVCDTCTNCITCTNYVTVLACPTNCCDFCTTNDYVSYSVVVQPGYNFLANVLCRGTNRFADLDTLLPIAPDGAMVAKWDYAAQDYDPNVATYLTGGGWDPNLTIKLGEGFALNDPGAAYTNTFIGCVPTCPRPCGPTNGCQLVGAYSTGMTTWDDLYRCPPECGTTVSVWNVTTQDWDVHTYLNGAWTPSAPAWPLGVGVMVCVQSDPRCCTNNLVLNGSFESTSPAVPSNWFDNHLDPTTGVPGWTTAAGEYLEVWANVYEGIPASQGVNHLEINAESADQTVTQTITGLRTNCPASFCFDYTGRFGMAGGSPNNDFTVTLSGGASMSVTLDPAEFATGGWLRFCTNFIPTSTTITIAFRGHPHYSDGTQNTEGGAHIDNVTLTQCCDTNPCSEPLVLICASNKTVECGTAWNFDPPMVQDPCCSNTQASVFSTTETGDACARVHVRTWVATNCLGHTTTCTQTVTVVDTTPPVISGECQSLVTLTFSGVVDAAFPGMFPPPWNTAQVGDPWSLTYTFDPAAPDSNPSPNLGYYDTAVKSFTLTIGLGSVSVIPDGPPSATSGASLRVYNDYPSGADQYEGTFYWPQNSFQFQLDDLSNTSWSVDSLPRCLDPARFSPAELTMGSGFYMIHCPVQSVACVSNSVCCSSNKTVECGTAWAFDPPAAWDACCGTNVSIRLISSNSTSLSPCQTIWAGVWQVSDCCSNSTTCTQTVTVVDTTPPAVAFCPTNIIACLGTNGCGVMPDATGQVLAHDACGSAVIISQSIPPGQPVCSNTFVVFTISDTCGNSTNCAAPVVVAPCCFPKPDGMKLWLTFDESVGVTCLNSMGGNNGIRYDGTVTANNANGPARLAGEYVNRSLCFDGVNDRVIVNSYNGINAGGQNFSMDLWVKWNGAPGTQCLLDKRTANADRTVIIGYGLFLRDGQPRLILGDGSPGSGTPFQLPTTLPANVWTHLAVTVDRNSSTGIRFYLNGSPANPTFSPLSQTGNLSTPAALWVGDSPVSQNATPFGGCLDEIEFFRRVLTPAEILGIYSAKEKGKCRPYGTVPSVLTMCSNSITIAATVCNPGGFGQTFTVSFVGLSPQQSGLPNAVAWPGSPNPFSPSATTVFVGPNSCVTFPVTIARPPALHGSPWLGSPKVAAYRMTVAAAGEQFWSIGRLVDGSWTCPPLAASGSPITNVLVKGTGSVVLPFTLTNPTNAAVTLHPAVRVLWAQDDLLVTETNVVSLNGLPPGTPWTTTVPLAPGGSSNLLVNVSFLDTQPAKPFYVVLEADIGENGAMEAIASATVLNENPATIGPVLNLSLSGSVPIISWDLVNSPFVLESSGSAGGTNWTPVPQLVVPLPDGSQGVILPGTNSSRYFRGRQ